MLKSKDVPSLNSSWAIGEDGYNKITKILSKHNINKIVEFGSGVSTVRLALDFPDARIISVEHDLVFFDKTLDLLRQYHIENVKVLHSILSKLRIGFRTYLSYNLSKEMLEYDVDFVLIDGPVESTTLRGREAPLYLVFPYLKLGGVVVLDDYHRKSAKRVVRNWLNSYPGTLKVIQEDSRLVFLEKCGLQDKPEYPGFFSMIDNYFVNMKLNGRKLKRGVKILLHQ